MTIPFFQKTFFKNKESQSIISYNREIGPSIEEVCRPLFENFNITMFTYSRIFNNGRRIYISTNPKWVEHYISNSYQNEINHLEHYIPADNMKCALWDSYKMDKVFYSVYNNFNFWHGFSIYERKEKYVDFFDFSAHKSNYQIVNFYLNKYELLDLFVKYFKSKSESLINFSDKSIWLTPKVWVPFNEIPRTVMIEQNKLNNFDKKIGFIEKKIHHFKPSLRINTNQTTDCKIISLSEIKYTAKESHCIRSLVQGKTANEIANVLKTSPKEVESHIAHVKRKEEVLTHINLIKFYEENLISSNELHHNLSTSMSKKTLSKVLISYKNVIEFLQQQTIMLSFQLYAACMHILNFILIATFS